MNIVGNVIQQLQQQSGDILSQLRNQRGCINITLFVNPIDRNTVDEASAILNNPQFNEERSKMPRPNDLDVIVDSFGGDADAAYHLAKLLDGRFSQGKISYIIPRYAKSAATLLVSGGDKIVMGETSELGPLDPQIRQNDGEFISAKAVQSTLELIKKQLKDEKKGLEIASILASRINPLTLGQYESTLQVAQEYQKELLSLRMFKGKPKTKISTVASKFANDYTHHSRVIGCSEAQELLGRDNVEILDNSSPVWNLIWQFYLNQKSIADLQGMIKALQNQ